MNEPLRNDRESLATYFWFEKLREEKVGEGVKSSPGIFGKETRRYSE